MGFLGEQMSLDHESARSRLDGGGIDLGMMEIRGNCVSI